LVCFGIRINFTQTCQNKTAGLAQAGGFIDSNAAYADSVDWRRSARARRERATIFAIVTRPSDRRVFDASFASRLSLTR
jgi:hypothetical protein